MSDQLWIATVIFGALGFIIWIAFRTPEEQGKPPAHGEAAPQATAEIPVGQQPKAGGAWTATGWTIATCGAVALALAISMKSTVEAYTPSTILGPGGQSEVANLDLMFQKGVAVAGSLTALGIGVFCIAVGAIINAISSRN